MQFYGRGLFAQPPITWAGGPYDNGLTSHLRKACFGTAALMLSVLDQPLRTISGGTCSLRSWSKDFVSIYFWPHFIRAAHSRSLTDASQAMPTAGDFTLYDQG